MKWFEFRRQMFHMIFGLVLASFLILLGIEKTLLVILAGIALGSITSLLILRGFKVPLFYQLVQLFGRDAEEIPGKGALSFVIGMGLLIAIFPVQKIALGAMLVTVIGDAFSTLVGKRFGKTKLLGEKSLEGSAAFFFSAEIALLAAGFSPLTALLVAGTGTVIELLPIEDNITIPLACGAVLSFLL